MLDICDLAGQGRAHDMVTCHEDSSLHITHHSHSDPVTRWITIGNFSPAPSSERPMGQSRGQGATSTRQQLSEEQGAPREA